MLLMLLLILSLKMGALLSSRWITRRWRLLLLLIFIADVVDALVDFELEDGGIVV